MGRLNPLPYLALLAACAPMGVAPQPLPYPGGFALGGLVTGRFQGVLPGSPLFLDADGEALYAAYPYQLLVLKEGRLESFPLPGVPRFLRAGARPIVGLGTGVWTPEGLLPYPALDAFWSPEGLYWVDGEGLHRESALLQRGRFRQVVPWPGGAAALGQEAFFFPEGRSIPLPHPVRKAQSGACGVVALMDGVYLVRPAGAKPLAPAEDFAAWEDQVYLTPGQRVVSCKEVVWP